MFRAPKGSKQWKETEIEGCTYLRLGHKCWISLGVFCDKLGHGFSIPYQRSLRYDEQLDFHSGLSHILGDLVGSDLRAVGIAPFHPRLQLPWCLQMLEEWDSRCAGNGEDLLQCGCTTRGSESPTETATEGFELDEN